MKNNFNFIEKKNLFEKMKSTWKMSTCFHILNKIIKFSYNRIKALNSEYFVKLTLFHIKIIYIYIKNEECIGILRLILPSF